MPELVSTHVVNALAPVVLLQHLEPFMRRAPPSMTTTTTTTTESKEEEEEEAAGEPQQPWAWCINVSSMEGKFNRGKTPFHPHTNAAKAALNMTTLTCAPDMRVRGILVVAVDTGWCTIEAPGQARVAPPLDEVDGAARVLDPVFANRADLYGGFVKDFNLNAW